ncbi:hypothetical protein PAEH1_02790 [Paenalcaligenes hominis]|uniref:Uncharacterized protein n=1 Tax=Paenalcaligenes hominis TaxID=643674 RepID=A0A1U9JY81_9BURK|nr:hypothetical protein [Paenalcaligenes hominis]AQS50750.1 hypothetical protein PAEH1_02790 [Paenalcaligenes hominis]
MTVFIGLAEVVLGTTTKTSEGINGAMRCIIQNENGTQLRAILKEGTDDEIRNELFCAVLLNAWGLSVPDPYIVTYNGKLAFACAEKNYPSLTQRLNITKNPPPLVIQIAIDLLASLEDTPLAVAIDELINNRDRNLGNILWDGGGKASWIDHSHCFSQASAKFRDMNKLADMVAHHPDNEKICRSSVAQALTLSSEAIIKARALLESHGIPADHTDYAELDGNIANLPNKVMARFPSQQANLFG